MHYGCTAQGTIEEDGCNDQFGSVSHEEDDNLVEIGEGKDQVNDKQT